MRKLTAFLLAGILAMAIMPARAESNYSDGYLQGIIDMIVLLDTPHMDSTTGVDTSKSTKYDKDYVYGVHDILDVIEQAVTDSSDIKTCVDNVRDGLFSLWEQVSDDAYLSGAEVLQLLTYIEYIYPPAPIDPAQYDCERSYNENYDNYARLCSASANAIWGYTDSHLSDDDMLFFQEMITNIADLYKIVTDFRRLVISYYYLYEIQGGKGFTVSP